MTTASAPEAAVARAQKVLDARGIELTWDDVRAAADAAVAPIAAQTLRDYRQAILDNPSSHAQTALDVADDIPEWIEHVIEADHA